MPRSYWRKVQTQSSALELLLPFYEENGSGQDQAPALVSLRQQEGIHVGCLSSTLPP